MSHIAWKRRFGWLLGGLAPAGPRKVILIYHALGPNPPAVTVAAFRQQLDWLHAHAELVSLPDLLQHSNAKGLQVALTFDDGYASLHDDVAPLLLQCGTSATVYLNTSHIGDKERQVSDPGQGHYPAQEFLTWPEVHKLADAGWCIGSHGVAHIDLTLVDPKDAASELEQSRQEIQLRLQQKCEHFAYTWGHYTPRLQQQVRNAGYYSAVSAVHGPLLQGSDIFALPRIDVRADYTLPDFIAAVTGRWDWLRYKQRLERKFS